MITTEDIMAVALCFADRELTDGEGEALSVLCEAANGFWEPRLRDELDPEDVKGLYCLACAYTALGNFLDGRGAATTASFRLGEFSVTRSGGSGSRGQGLRETAERLMAPLTADLGFAFLEVDG